MKNDIVYLLNQIEKLGYRSYIVGGYVRDTLLGFEPHDCDIVTDAPIEDVKNLFKNYKPKLFKFNSLKIVYKNTKYDITQFRREIYDGEKTVIETTDDMYEDYMRRDFTINAIYMSKDGKLTSFGNSINDCKNKKLNFIGNPQLKCKEDPIRIIRFAYYFLRYDLVIDDTIKSIHVTEDDFKKCNIDLLNKYIIKIYNTNKFNEFIDLIQEIGIYNYIFGARDFDKCSSLKEQLNNMGYKFINQMPKKYIED